MIITTVYSNKTISNFDPSDNMKQMIFFPEINTVISM